MIQYTDKDVAYSDNEHTEWLINLPKMINNHANHIQELITQVEQINSQNTVIITKQLLRKIFKECSIETGQGSRFDEQKCYRMILDTSCIDYDGLV